MPWNGVNYSRCTIGQLRTLIEQRTGDVPKDGEVKTNLLTTLQQLDESMTFRFMDLPAELKNCVYRELLSPGYNEQGVKRRIWPAILATSKGVNKEAKSILYEENTMHISIRSTAERDAWTMRRGGRTVVELTERVTTKVGKLPTFQSSSDDGLSTTLSKWPSAMKNITNVVLRVFLNGSSAYRGQSERPYVKVNHELYLMASLMRAGGNLENIWVDVKIGQAQLTTAQIDEILFPLTKLDDYVQLHFRRMPVECRDNILARVKPVTKGAYTLDPHHIGLEKEGALQLAFMNSSSSDATLKCRVSLQKRRAKIEKMMKTKSMMGEKEDEKLTKCVRLLHRYMDSRPVRKAALLAHAGR